MDDNDGVGAVGGDSADELITRVPQSEIISISSVSLNSDLGVTMRQ